MSRKWWVLTSVGCGTFMATLDSSIVNIALPTLTQEFHADLYRVKWVVVAYLFTLTCLLLPFGRLSDCYGRKRIFKAGFLIFVTGSMLCGWASSLSLLVIFRAFQAVGASMLMANGPAVIMKNFRLADRGSALGTLAMVVSAGLLSGPGIGGFCIAHFGWRSIFYINIPVGLTGILLVEKFFKQDVSASQDLKLFDWGGAILQSALLFMMMIIFDPPHLFLFGELWLLPRWLISVLASLLFVSFIQIEKSAKLPLFDLSLLRNSVFITGNLAGFLTFVAFSSVSILMPFYLEEILGFSPQKAGLYMTAIPLTIFVVAPISGRLSDRFGSLGLTLSGIAVGILSLFMISGMIGSGIQASTDGKTLIGELCLMGLAIGLFQPPNNSAIMGSVPIAKLGVASALLATIRNLGLVASAGMTTDLFSWQLAMTQEFVGSLHTTFGMAAFIGIGAFFVSWSGNRFTQVPSWSGKKKKKISL